MRAPDPAWARLWRLAGVPSERAQAWRAQGDLLGTLDREVDVAAGRSDALLLALLSPPQVGAQWGTALARLETAATTGERAEPVRGWVRSAAALAATAPTRAAVPVREARADAGTATAAAATLQRWGFAGPAAMRQRALPPDAAAARDATLMRPGPAPRAPDFVASVTNAAWREPTIAAAAAQTRIEARLRQAQLLPAWSQVIAPGVAVGAAEALNSTTCGAAASAAAGVTPSRHAAEPGRAAQPRASEPAAGIESQMPRGIAPRVTPASRVRDPRPGSAPDAATALAARLERALPPPATLAGARIGGFRGLAALGRALGPPAAATAVAHASPQAPGPETPPAAPSIHPQFVIDQIESALREQAARSGIALDGVEP